MKKKSGQATSKKYIYHDNLQFLLKIIKKDDTVSSMEHSEQLIDSDEEKQEETVVDIQSQNTPRQTCNQRKKPRLQEDVDREILQVLRSSNTAPDEDEAFFMSLIPSVRRMSEEEKLDFRMSVLQVLKDINSRRRETTVFETRRSASTSASPTTTPYPSVMADNNVSEYKILQADQFVISPRM